MKMKPGPVGPPEGQEDPHRPRSGLWTKGDRCFHLKVALQGGVGGRRAEAGACDGTAGREASGACTWKGCRGKEKKGERVCLRRACPCDRTQGGEEAWG